MSHLLPFEWWSYFGNKLQNSRNIFFTLNNFTTLWASIAMHEQLLRVAHSKFDISQQMCDHQWKYEDIEGCIWVVTLFIYQILLTWDENTVDHPPSLPYASRQQCTCIPIHHWSCINPIKLVKRRLLFWLLSFHLVPFVLKCSSRNEMTAFKLTLDCLLRLSDGREQSKKFSWHVSTFHKSFQMGAVLGWNL
jgi:hypothetical protein